MKKHVFASAVLLLPLLGGLAGCTQPGEDEVQYIKVSMASCSFRGVDAEPLRIEVSANPAAWSAEPSATWIKITEQTPHEMVLSVEDNPSNDERTGEVTLTAGQASQTIKVIQVADHALQSRYATLGDYTMGAVISPNGRYVGGYTATFDAEVNTHILQITVTDIRSGEEYLLDPFTGALYNLYDPSAITDSGDIFFHCEDGRSVKFSLGGDITVLNNIPGAGKPWIQSVASDESGIWVGFCLGGETVYSPVKWTDGVPEILPLPAKTYRENKDWLQGGMARGCSLDGTVIYGTAWEGLDSGLMWWDKEGNVRWVGDELHKIKPVEIFDQATQTYYAANLVDGIIGSNNTHAISPSGRWIAGTYRTEELNEAKTEVLQTSCPAFYDTVNDEVYLFPEFEGACGMTATDEGIGIIGLGAAGGILSSTHVVKIEEETSLSSTTDWIYDTYGIIIPNGYLEFISPDGEVAFGYDLEGTGGEMMRKWYVAPNHK